MIYDCFTFFNELDLLEIRLNILDEHVDYFVLAECTETFSGIEKPLYYEENKERFSKWSHKIIHHINEKIQAPDPFQRAHYQKEMSFFTRHLSLIKASIQFFNLRAKISYSFTWKPFAYQASIP